MMHVLAFASLFAHVGATSAPTQPHLSQAWIAHRQGDFGNPNPKEYYLYENRTSNGAGALQARIWDYGEWGASGYFFTNFSKKIQIDTLDGYRKDLPWGTYFVQGSNGCCFASNHGAHPDRPRVGKLDFRTEQARFVGYEDVKDLFGNVVRAERWEEYVASECSYYDYFVTRKNSSDDVTTVQTLTRHDCTPTGTSSIGQNEYGNFTMIRDAISMRKLFELPRQCIPVSEGGPASKCTWDTAEHGEEADEVVAAKKSPEIIV